MPDMPEITPSYRDGTAVKNTWEFQEGFHKGRDYTQFKADDYPTGLVINVAKGGITNHELLVAQEGLIKIQNSWKLVKTQMETDILRAEAHTAGARAIGASAQASAAFNQLGVELNGLRESAIRLENSEINLHLTQLENEILKFREEIKVAIQPLAIANELLQAETVKENFVMNLGVLLKTKTDRALGQQVLSMQGYNTSMLPEIDFSTINMPKVDLPAFNPREGVNIGTNANASDGLI